MNKLDKKNSTLPFAPTEKVNVNIQGSLRNRLFLMLLIPLIFISCIFAIESYQNAYNIAKTSFDKELAILSLTLIEQDDNIYGNRLSEDILDVYKDIHGNNFFYYAIVTGSPIITGYSKRPIPKKLPDNASGKPFLFDGKHRGKRVRAAYVTKQSSLAGFSGEVRLTVWQTFDKQFALQNSIFLRSLVRIISLITLVALSCWFGVRSGLRPLEELQNAIDKRTLTDLESIKRGVPVEVKSLVGSMNNLFSRLQTAIKKREAFLANASHQLKTPLANMQGKAELALRAKDNDMRHQHINDLITINKQSSRLTSQMLSLLRAESDDILINPMQQFELNALVRDVCIHYAPTALQQGREIHFQDASQNIQITGHPLLITECIGNLIENSMAYSRTEQNIEVELSTQIQKHQATDVFIKIHDSGPGIPKELQEKVMSRFYRMPSSTKIEGCGLGLAIVREIVKNHYGEIYFDNLSAEQFTTIIRLPMNSEAN